MVFKPTAQGTLVKTDDYFLFWLEASIMDRRARGMSKGTIKFYTTKLKLFADYCEGQELRQITQITPFFIREYLLHLERTHNPGGVHACYCALRAFLYWWEDVELISSCSMRRVSGR